MQLIFEIFPVLLFFLAFKFYGIYVATTVGIVTTFLQTLLGRIGTGKWDKKQLVILGIFILFGGMTLYFHDPIFVKWKPTVVFWLFALTILLTHFTSKPLLQRMMENMVQEKAIVPIWVWRKLNLIWAVFFAILGSINLYIAYHYDSNTWVNFKLYGITSAVLIFSIIQAIYLSRFANENLNGK